MRGAPEAASVGLLAVRVQDSGTPGAVVLLKRRSPAEETGAAEGWMLKKTGCCSGTWLAPFLGEP